MLLAREPLVRQAHYEVFVQEYVFRLQVVVTKAKLLKPQQAVDQLPQDDAQRDFAEAVGVLQLVEQFAVANILHLDVWQARRL